MLVFIDESGDPGFKLNKGSSSVFVLSMVIFDTSEHAHSASNLIKSLQVQQRIKPEWKFSKSKNTAKDAFFAEAHQMQFRCRAVVVQKELIRSGLLRTSPRRFYSFFTRMICQHDGGALNNAKVIIDGSGDRAFKKELQSYLRREMPRGAIKKMDFKDSRKDPLVQLADMCAGAIARSYSDQRPDADRWRQALLASGRLHNVWEFR